MRKITHDNYTSINLFGQLELPVDTAYLPATLKKDEFFLRYIEIFEQLDVDSCFKEKTRPNAKHNPVNLLAAIILAYVLYPSLVSVRRLEELCKFDIRFICLTDEKCPTASTFERCMQKLDLHALSQVAQQAAELIGEAMGYSKKDLMGTQYVDGTKIEANANKYSFVFKKRVVNSIKKKIPQITKKINEINENEAINLPFKLDVLDYYSAKDLLEYCWYLWAVMKDQGIEFKYGRGRRKSELQRALDAMIDFYEFIAVKEIWLVILGSRNSCSKTDRDAVFLLLKRDLYNKTGNLTPAYNLQIAVSCGLITESRVFQNPHDANTYPAFIEAFKKYWGDYPKRVAADAGYGYLNNFRFNKENNIETFIKTIYFDKKKESKFRKNIKNRENWGRDQFGNFMCPQGRVFTEVVEGSDGEVENNGVTCWQITLTEPHHCEGCPVREQCTTNENGRTITVKPEYEHFKEDIERNLNSPEGRAEMIERNIQVEGAFGILKNNHHVTRFRHRGLANVTKEVKLHTLGYNFQKLRVFLEKNKEKEEVLTVASAAPQYEQDLLSL